MKKNRFGFTLVELVIVMAILLVMVVMVTGIFNATGVFNRARDARRKKDIARIKVAFEEYFNDRGCYPTFQKAEELMLPANCGSKTVFSPWLSPWPCEPGNVKPYQIVVEGFRDTDCSKWFKVLTKLENLSDSVIPLDWGVEGARTYGALGGDSTVETANYGVSSADIIWSDYRPNAECAAYGGCYYEPGEGLCNAIIRCTGPNCFLGKCREACRVTTCN